MASIKLNERALVAYEAHLKRRARLEQRIDDLVEKLDHEDERVVLEVLDHMGMETDDWELDGRFFDEFRVVLLRPWSPPQGEGEEEPLEGEEPPERDPARPAN